MSYLNSNLLNSCVNSLSESFSIVNKNRKNSEFYGFMHLIKRCLETNPDLINNEIKKKMYDFARTFFGRI